MEKRKTCPDREANAIVQDATLSIEKSDALPVGYLLVSSESPGELGIRGKWLEKAKVWIRVE